MIERILVVDDEPLLRDFVAETLRRKKLEVVVAADGKEAIAKLKASSFELIITDLKMPNAGGLEVLKAAKALNPQTLVMIATAFGSIETAVEAMKLGAFNFLIKPFSPEALEINLEKAETHLRQLAETRFYKEEQSLFSMPGSYRL